MSNANSIENFLVSDAGKLKLVDEKIVSTKLQASAMSRGKLAMIIGSVLIILGGVYVYMLSDRKRKGGRS